MKHSSAMGIAACMACAALAVLLLSIPGLATEQPRLHVVVVANNASLDEDVRPLRFADDDGAKYFEVFTAAGADVTLLSVLDENAQQRFTRAAQGAIPPTRANLLSTVRKVFDQMEQEKASGLQTRFFFVYTGHGNVGPNREGYINLADARFTRSELYKEVIAPSPATYNHLILDACHAYYFVNKRGGQPDKKGDYSDKVRAFLSQEELSSYPNTGVILAASSESETHEWSRLESGIFSHELISCLVGAGDVDGDAAVTYDEAAACVEAANHAILVPRARLKVHYRAPAQLVDEPLMRLDAFASSVRLQLPTTMASRYYIEDSRGIRTADFHFTAEQPITLALVGQQPFFVRTEDGEAIIPTDTPMVAGSDLEFSALGVSHKGSVEQSFRKHLFETPFGRGFLLGMVAEKSRLDEPPLPPMAEPINTHPEPEPPLVQVQSAQKPSSTLRVLGFTSMGLALGTGLASGLTYYAASQSHEDYNQANTAEGAADLRETTQNRTLASQVLLGGSVVFAAASATLLIVDGVRRKPERETSQSPTRTPYVAAADGALMLGVSGEF